jgi:nicotinamide mononucleotide transporter
MLEELKAWSVPELVAVLLAIAYLLLAIRENIWCWMCAAVSTAIYVWLFVRVNLYMESLLNVFYFGMAVYGWCVWRKVSDDSGTRPVVVWPLAVHAAALGAIVVASTLSGFLLHRYTDAAYPYIDSATTFAAIWATFLVARKVLENWWYWLLVDSVSIFIYWARDLQLTSILFVLYVLLIPFGLLRWTRSYRRQHPAVAA